MLVSYVDSSYADNNTSQHPGHGLVLPVDAHPAAVPRPGGGYWRVRIAAYDATFDESKTKDIKLHISDVEARYPARPGNRVFDDTASYFDAIQPTAGVLLPALGVRIEILMRKGTTMQVRVGSTVTAARPAAAETARPRSRLPR